MYTRERNQERPLYYVFTYFTDNDNKFAFIIDSVAVEMARKKDRIIWVLESTGSFKEEYGSLREFGLSFLGMLFIVEANAKNDRWVYGS